MMSESLSSLLFKKLKPTCIKVANNPTLKTLQELRNLLSSLQRKSLQENALVTYVLFPLKLHLKRIKNDDTDICLLILDVLSVLFEKSLVADEEILLDIINICCSILSSKEIGKDGVSLLSNASEEKKIALLKVVATVLGSSNENCFAVLFHEKNFPTLGHAISLFLSVVQHERSKQLRLFALDILIILSDVKSDDKKWTKMTQQLASEAFANLIPGISICLQKILCGDPKSGHGVLSRAIDAWSCVIYLVLNDIQNIANSTKPDYGINEKCNNINHSVETHNGVIGVNSKRDKKWLHTTSKNISALIAKVFDVVTCKSHNQIVTALLGLTNIILCHCLNTLNGLVNLSIGFIASCLSADGQGISELASNVLNSAQENMNNSDDYDSIAMVTAYLDNLLLALPRVLHNTDETLKESHLCKLYGYFQILGSSLSTILISPSLIEKLVIALLQVFDVDFDNVKVIEERDYNDIEPFISILEDDSVINPLHPVLYFKFIHGLGVCELLDKICLQLVHCGDVVMVMNYLIDIFETDSDMRIQCILLVKLILNAHQTETSSCMQDDKNMYGMIGQLLGVIAVKDWLDLDVGDNMNATVDVQSIAPDLHVTPSVPNSIQAIMGNQSIKQLNRNIHLICVILETVAKSSDVLGSEFQPYLITTLYPLLEKLGCNNRYVRSYALHACQKVAHNCGCISISDLITQNADYLLNEVTLSLRHLSLSPSAPGVLSVAFNYSSKDTLILIINIMDEVFTVIDRHKSHLGIGVFNVMYSLNCAVIRCFVEDKEINNKMPSKSKANVKDALYYSNMFTEYCHNHAIAHGIIDDESDNAADQPVFNPDDETIEVDQRPSLPPQYNAVIKILERCISYLTIKDVQCVLMVCNVVKSGVKALRSREDDLLPLIHKLWPAVLENCKDSRQVVGTRSLELAETMVLCSGDFMRQRIVKELLPHVESILDSYNNKLNSRQNILHCKSRFSQNSKHIIKILQFMGVVIPSLDIQGKDLFNCLVAMESSITMPLNESIQKAALIALKAIQLHQPDQVWYFLAIIGREELRYENNAPLRTVIFNKGLKDDGKHGIRGDRLSGLLEMEGIEVPRRHLIE